MDSGSPPDSAAFLLRVGILFAAGAWLMLLGIAAADEWTQILTLPFVVVGAWVLVAGVVVTGFAVSVGAFNVARLNPSCSSSVRRRSAVLLGSWALWIVGAFAVFAVVV